MVLFNLQSACDRFIQSYARSSRALLRFRSGRSHKRLIIITHTSPFVNTFFHYFFDFFHLFSGVISTGFPFPVDTLIKRFLCHISRRLLSERFGETSKFQHNSLWAVSSYTLSSRIKLKVPLYISFQTDCSLAQAFDFLATAASSFSRYATITISSFGQDRSTWLQLLSPTDFLSLASNRFTILRALLRLMVIPCWSWHLFHRCFNIYGHAFYF